MMKFQNTNNLEKSSQSQLNDAGTVENNFNLKKKPRNANKSLNKADEKTTTKNNTIRFTEMYGSTVGSS